MAIRLIGYIKVSSVRYYGDMKFYQSAVDYAIYNNAQFGGGIHCDRTSASSRAALSLPDRNISDKVCNADVGLLRRRHRDRIDRLLTQSMTWKPRKEQSND